MKEIGLEKMGCGLGSSDPIPDVLVKSAWNGVDGMEADAGWIQWGFSGVSTFAHLKHTKCLTSTDTLFDIALLGVPFDTAVSYRPGMSFPSQPNLSPSPLFRVIPKETDDLTAVPVSKSILLTKHRGSFRPPRHPRRLRAPNLLSWLQPPCRPKPLHLMGINPRLWGHPRNAPRQRRRTHTNDIRLSRTRAPLTSLLHVKIPENNLPRRRSFPRACGTKGFK